MALTASAPRRTCVAMEQTLGITVPLTLEDVASPRDMALLIYDMQVGIVSQLKNKITMSAFEGTPLAIALRDCGVRAIAVAGIALEIGIEPTARHAADLGIIPVIVTDACGGGHAEAAERSLESLKFAGDSILTDVATLRRLLSRK